MELRLGARFEADIESSSIGDDFLYHLTHLIDLYGIDNVILRFIAVLFGCNFKTGRNFFDPVVQNLREPYQNRRGNIAKIKLTHQFVQINGSAG
ncbi:hypothetical protein SDC9_130481 [bioreactor metagenome]|uniref:Uncharacterized protein n=1 Tax=bioreactor metagenome TaxID=1076179 RepID=A0A645D2M7_9ZZZZ